MKAILRIYLSVFLAFNFQVCAQEKIQIDPKITAFVESYDFPKVGSIHIDKYDEVYGVTFFQFHMEK